MVIQKQSCIRQNKRDKGINILFVINVKVLDFMSSFEITLSNIAPVMDIICWFCQVQVLKILVGHYFHWLTGSIYPVHLSCPWLVGLLISFPSKEQFIRFLAPHHFLYPSHYWLATLSSSVIYFFLNHYRFNLSCFSHSLFHSISVV